MPTYDEQLHLIDMEIQRLILIRSRLVIDKARSDEVQAMRKRGKMLFDMLQKALTFTDLDEATSYMKGFIIPWKNYLPGQYFPNTLETIPDTLPNNWNIIEGCILILQIEEAVDLDCATLNDLD
jgi:hypothetical protein